MSVNIYTYYINMHIYMGFPGDSVVKNLPAMQETQETRVRSLGGEDPLEESMATHSVFLPGKSHGQRSLVGYNLWCCKESDTTEVTEHACTHMYTCVQIHVHILSAGMAPDNQVMKVKNNITTLQIV